MKKIYAVLIIILITFNVHALEIDKVSLWAQGFSIHSAGEDMNERHENRGICIDWACFMVFTNSLNDPGEALFVNHTIIDKKYFVLGARYGLIWGYEESPMLFVMPFWGLGYKYLWFENTVIPSPALDGHYLMITLIRLEIYNKKW